MKEKQLYVVTNEVGFFKILVWARSRKDALRVANLRHLVGSQYHQDMYPAGSPVRLARGHGLNPPGKG